MTVNVGQAAIVRFPREKDLYLRAPSVAKVLGYRGSEALVAKRTGSGLLTRWGKPRWVPAAEIAREASPREVALGMPVDPVPARAA